MLIPIDGNIITVSLPVMSAVNSSVPNLMLNVPSVMFNPSFPLTFTAIVMLP